MKKIIFVLAAALCGFAASAFNLEANKHLSTPIGGKFSLDRAPEALATPKARQSRAELSLVYNLASEPYGATSMKGQAIGNKFALAHELNADNATKFAGNKITSINFYTGTNSATKKNQIKTYTVFLTKDLQGEPFYSQEVSVGTTPYSLVQATLDSAYTIEAGVPVYYGIKYALASASDSHIVVDYVAHATSEGGWYAVYDATKNTYSWNNFFDQLGYSCISATITGENLPTNIAEIDAIVSTPVVEAGNGFSMAFRFVNLGANDISSIDFAIKVGENDVINQGGELESPLSFGQSAVVPFDGVVYNTASKEPVQVAAIVTKVNGQPNKSLKPGNATSTLVIPSGGGFKKNVVIEEITGNWCGYCPAGIVTMEGIREKYNYEGIIPVCVHVNQQGTRDPMYNSSYAPVANFGSGSVPDAVLNRSELANNIQDAAATEEQVLALASIPAIGKIDLDVTTDAENPRKITIAATTRFTFDYTDADSIYALSFGITECNVGPYKQTNNFAGSSTPVGGWESQPSSVSMTYNDVARQLDKFEGIAGSIPAEVSAQTPVTYKHTMTLASNIKDPHNARVIGYLQNLKTKAIENVTSFSLADFFEAGLEGVEADNNAPAEYYNLQGIRVANPANGIFIRRQGTKTSKIRF